MAVTITNRAALTPFEQALRRAAASRVTGASAPTVVVSLLSDSKGSYSVPKYQRRNRETNIGETWFGLLVNAFKQYAGDAGEVLPAAHVDEVYRGGKYDAVQDLVLWWGDGWSSAYAGTKNGMRGYAWSKGETTGGSTQGMAGYHVKVLRNGPRRYDPFPHPFRFLDVVYGKSNTDTQPLLVTIDDGTPTQIVCSDTGDSYNNVATLDAGTYGYHSVILNGDTGSNYSRVEALVPRTGYPGVIGMNCGVSGRAWSDVPSADADKLVYAGHTAYAPNLVVIEMGYNDAASGAGGGSAWDATTQAYIEGAYIDFLDAIDDDVPVLIVKYPWNDSATDRSTFWDNVMTTVLAGTGVDAGRICIADCYDTLTGWDSYANAVTNGYLYAANKLPTWTQAGCKGAHVRVGFEVQGDSGSGVMDLYRIAAGNAGVCGTSEPDWTTAPDPTNTVVDNTATWTNVSTATTDATHPTRFGHKIWARDMISAFGWEYMVPDWRGHGGRLGIGL